MDTYDIADPNDPNTLVVPFLFVPHGYSPPEEWLREHPGWVRFPAVLVPRRAAGEGAAAQWDVQFDIPDELATGASLAEELPPTSDGGGVHPPAFPCDSTAHALAAWRQAEAQL